MLGVRTKKQIDKRFIEFNLKSQSAMEYLMTYGWAILIIAVVLGALFQLGVFSGIGTPKAQPGNCQVVKVGSGITQTISLEGECQGQQPEYVAQFNGGSSFVSVPKTSSDTVSGTQITISTWISESGAGVNCPRILDGGAVNVQYTFTANCGGTDILWRPETSGGSVSLNSNPLSYNTWYDVAVTYNGVSAVLYVDGQQVGSPAALTGTLNTGSAPISIGGNQSEGSWFAGDISNVQLYNVSLAPAEISVLYQEGISGAPIRPQNIVGWWPLNGNAQDYSGNNNNGQPSGITFSSSWTSGYTQP